MIHLSPVGFLAAARTVKFGRGASLALVASLGLALPPALDLRKMKPMGSAVQPVMFMVLPGTSADITAAPASSFSATGTAGFTVHARPILAAVVNARRLRGWARTRIGGLYGP